MSRCKACDNVIDLIIDAELCHVCIRSSKSEYFYSYDHQYVLENAQEGLTVPVAVEE